MPDYTASSLASTIGATLAAGDPSRPVARCATLDRASPDSVSFVSNPKYLKQLDTTLAGTLILSPDAATRFSRPDVTVLTHKDPYFAFRQAIVALHGFRQHPPADHPTGISPNASVHPTAKLGKNVTIHPGAVVMHHVSIGDNTVLYPNVTLMPHASLGSDCILYPSATVYDHCVLGHRVILQASAAIGVDGYGFATHQGAHHKIPQTGNVILEDDVEIGGGTVVERAVLDSTVIAQGTKIGNSVVIGHNTQIGPHNLLVSQVGIAGSASTGKYVVLAGQVGVAGHLHITDMARVAAQSGVAADIDTPGEYGGSPAMEAKHARRVYLQFMNLPDLAKRVKELESELKKLQKTAP